MARYIMYLPQKILALSQIHSLASYVVTWNSQEKHSGFPPLSVQPRMDISNYLLRNLSHLSIKGSRLLWTASLSDNLLMQQSKKRINILMMWSPLYRIKHELLSVPIHLLSWLLHCRKIAVDFFLVTSFPSGPYHLGLASGTKFHGRNIILCSAFSRIPLSRHRMELSTKCMEEVLEAPSGKPPYSFDAGVGHFNRFTLWSFGASAMCNLMRKG